MANKHNCVFNRIDDVMKDRIVEMYLTPESKKTVTESFGITVYALDRILRVET